MDAGARALLLSYSWPGNVRELSHVIERAVLWSRGPALRAEHLSGLHSAAVAAHTAEEPTPEAARLRVDPAALTPTSSAAAAFGLPPGRMDLAEWERSMIEQALREAGGNQTRAAERLGISRDTLRYRLKKFGIQA
jgi:DNA-binding NtrC family response regulator